MKFNQSNQFYDPLTSLNNFTDRLNYPIQKPDQQKQKQQNNPFKSEQKLLQKLSNLKQPSYIYPQVHHQYCPSNFFPLKFLCLNKNCKKQPYLCQNKNCSCLQQHQKCNLCSAQRLINTLQGKIIKQEKRNKLIRLIEKIIDGSIDWLSEFREKIVDQIAYYGLGEKQMEVLKKIKEGSRGKKEEKMEEKEHQKLKAQQIANILPNLGQQSNALQTSTLQKQLTNYWQQTNQKNFQQIFIKIQSIVNNSNFQGKSSKLFIQSNIITQYTQQSYIQTLLHRQINSINLLYRASQNIFSMQMFYQKCSKITNTLLLIKVKNDQRIFGGFTTQGWKKSLTEQQRKDQSKLTVLFKMEKNKKINQEKNKKIQDQHNDKTQQEYVFSKYRLKNDHLKTNIIATCYRPGWGPAFGQANKPDLLLTNKLDLNSYKLSSQTSMKQQNKPQLYWRVGTNYIKDQQNKQNEGQKMEIQHNHHNNHNEYILNSLQQDQRLQVQQWQMFQIRF